MLTRNLLPSFLVIFILCSQAYSDIEISKSRNTEIQIVLPDSIADSNIEYFLSETALLIQRCLKGSCGVDPEVVREKDFTAASGVFLGSTRAAAENGVMLAEGKSGWEYRIKAAGNNVFLKGIDKAGKRDIKNFAFHKLGTAKAAVDFLQQFLNVQFLLPGKSGVYVPRKDKIVIPAGFDRTYHPQIQFCTSRHKEIFYDLASNFLPSVNYGTHGGHSHNIAIPVEKYGKSNPEYFRMAKGRRIISKKRPLYCISNPEVRELIYQELLSHADKGYRVIQLGQPDGFLGCDCEGCAALYGISLEGSREEYWRAWGEKLWIMHRAMAVRFLKDRPGKMLAVMAYGPAKHPPVTFKKFPENVIVELAKYAEENFIEWSKVSVPAGFYVYIYNWGKYHGQGFTPKHTPGFITKQVRLFHKYNVKGIYRCGFGELFGLEGPVYYLYGRLLANPEGDAERLLAEYYRGFEVAAEPVKNFFDLLHSRLETRWGGNEDWNDPDLIDGIYSPANKLIRTLRERYPADVMKNLEKYLSEAEEAALAEKNGKSEKLKNKLFATRMEFNYLKMTIESVRRLTAYRKDSSIENYKALRRSIQERKGFIMSLPQVNSKPVPLFGRSRTNDLLYGQRGQLDTPFKWDFDFFDKYGINPGCRSIRVGEENNKREVSALKKFYDKSSIMLSPVFDNLENYVLERPTYVGVEVSKGRIKCSFICENSGKKDLENDKFTVILAPDASGRMQFRFTYRPQKNKVQISKLVQKSAARNWEGDLYWPYGTSCGAEFLIKDLPGEKLAVVSMTVPLDMFVFEESTLGESWQANFIREGNSGRETYIWQPELVYRTRRDKQSSLTGSLILPDSFEREMRKTAMSDKNLLMNGDFEGSPEGNSVAPWKMAGYINGNVDNVVKKKLLESMQRKVVLAEGTEKENRFLHLANLDESLQLRDSKGWPIISSRIYQIVQLPESEENSKLQVKLNVSGKNLYDDKGKGWNGLTLYLQAIDKEGRKTNISRRIFADNKKTLVRQNINILKGTVSLRVEFAFFGAGDIYLDDIGLYQAENGN
ncbi:MAG: DUF4838 domain-containing protein [Planctomycetota bacterium]|jgi:hypothetical protein